jgi:hypothetical protein
LDLVAAADASALLRLVVYAVTGGVFWSGSQ